MISAPIHHNAVQPPSGWLVRHVGAMPAGGRVLDVACGSGRHTRFLLELGFRLCAVDISLDGVRDLAAHPDTELLQHDLELGHWPFGRSEKGPRTAGARGPF